MSGIRQHIAIGLHESEREKIVISNPTNFQHVQRAFLLLVRLYLSVRS